jgi:hypothetical protein
MASNICLYYELCIVYLLELLLAKVEIITRRARFISKKLLFLK